MGWDELDKFYCVGAVVDSSCLQKEILMEIVSEERWLSLEEIAAHHGIKRDTVYKWIDRRNMPAHKVGSLWKFKRVEIDEWVRSGDAGESDQTRKPK
jgi:excisionase family DNA binding protein